MKQKINALSVEFLYELYATAIRNDYVCGILVEHMRKEYLPDRTFQKIQQVLTSHYKTYKTPPSYSVLSQSFTGDYDAIELINTFQEFDDGNNPEVMVDMNDTLINRMYGYAQPMQADFTRDSVTPLDTSKKLTFKVNPYDSEVKSFSDGFI